MRLQLALASTALLVSVALVPDLAHADGTVAMRGVYYKERATRVMQPMLDGMFEIGTRGILEAHLLVDAITSASSSSGASTSSFTERRYEAGAGYTRDLGWLRLSGSAKYSTEPDYTSMYVGARGEVDLAQKNTVLGLGVGIVSDEITAGQAQGLSNPMIACRPDAPLVFTKTCSLTGYALYLSASQIVSREMVVSATYDLTQSNGYLSNPYRQVIAGDAFAPERHPAERKRQAFGLSTRYFMRSLRTTIVAAYRYYRDDWKVRAHTPEIRIIQDVGRTVDATFRYRYYWQTRSFFHRARYDSADPMENLYMSDDPKLTKFDGHTLEAKLGIRGEAFGLEDRWSEARFEGILGYVLQDNRFGNAITAHVALTVPFEY